MKCFECEKSKATMQCIDCGEYYCSSCADIYEEFCECMRTKNIKLIKKEKIKND